MESVYSTIQISTAAVSDNYNTTKAAICNMAEAPEIVDFPAKIGPEKVHIIYSGPTPSAGKDSVGSQHGSFIVSWDNPHIPKIICAVAHPGSVSHSTSSSSHNLAAAWAVAVILGEVSKYDIPEVEIICNSRYATKIFEKANRPNKYKDIWAYILNELLPAVQRGRHFASIKMIHGAPESQIDKDMRQRLSVGLLCKDNPVPLITTVNSCRDFLAKLQPLSPAILTSLHAGRILHDWLSNPKDAIPTVTYHKAKSGTSSDVGEDSWDMTIDFPMDSNSPQIPPQTLPSPPEPPMEATSDVSPIPPMEPNTPPDSLFIHRNVTTTEDSPWSAPAQASTQESFHLHLDSTLQPSHDSCVPSPSQEVLVITQPGQSAVPMIVDLTHSQTPQHSCASSSENVSKGFPPRERSLAHDPVPAIIHSGPKALSLPFLRGSKSTPASPNRPLVPAHPMLASSLTRLSAPTGSDDQSQLVPSQESSFQDAQRPYSPDLEDQSIHTPPLFTTPPSLEPETGTTFQPQVTHVDQSREALKRAPIPTISPQEVVDFTIPGSAPDTC